LDCHVHTDTAPYLVPSSFLLLAWPLPPLVLLPRPLLLLLQASLPLLLPQASPLPLLLLLLLLWDLLAWLP
jgi:hypothetical protein